MQSRFAERCSERIQRNAGEGPGDGAGTGLGDGAGGMGDGAGTGLGVGLGDGAGAGTGVGTVQQASTVDRLSMTTEPLSGRQPVRAGSRPMRVEQEKKTKPVKHFGHLVALDPEQGELLEHELLVAALEEVPRLEKLDAANDDGLIAGQRNRLDVAERSGAPSWRARTHAPQKKPTARRARGPPRAH